MRPIRANHKAMKEKEDPSLQKLPLVAQLSFPYQSPFPLHSVISQPNLFYVSQRIYLWPASFAFSSVLTCGKGLNVSFYWTKNNDNHDQLQIDAIGLCLPTPTPLLLAVKEMVQRVQVQSQSVLEREVSGLDSVSPPPHPPTETTSVEKPNLPSQTDLWSSFQGHFLD